MGPLVGATRATFKAVEREVGAEGLKRKVSQRNLFESLFESL